MFHWATLYLISEWAIRAVMLLHVPQRRSPGAARSWLLIIFLLPWPGLLLYGLLGRAQMPKRRQEMQQRASKQIRAAGAQLIHRHYVSQPALPANLSQAVRLATRLGEFDPFGGNSFELLDDYQASIDRLIADIDAAKHHVHLLFYIFEEDDTGRRVADAVSCAAQRGVKARVLMDAVGSKRALRGLACGLREKGVEVCALLPVGLFRRNTARYDLRNHRKIAVIDGRIGYTGSQNIVDPAFVPGRPNRELVLRVLGPLVSQLQAVLLADCYFETGKSILEEELFPRMDPAGNAIAQILPSGPGYQYENGQEVVVALLHGATRRAVIATPYFIPDEPVLQAIISAVLRGVEVHLVVSRESNQYITEFAQQSFYEELLTVGVKIHRYRPHFLHAKHVSIDDDIAIVGTANMDIRSFKLNAEVVAIIYDTDVVKRLHAIEEAYFAESELLTTELWSHRPTWRRLAQNVARMADALL